MSEPQLPFTSIARPQDTQLMWTISPLWTGRCTVSPRTIKEVIFIHINDPSLKRNLGKYQLYHIWDEALHDTQSLLLSNLVPPFPPYMEQSPPNGSTNRGPTQFFNLVSIVLPLWGANSPPHSFLFWTSVHPT